MTGPVRAAVAILIIIWGVWSAAPAICWSGSKWRAETPGIIITSEKLFVVSSPSAQRCVSQTSYWPLIVIRDNCVSQMALSWISSQQTLPVIMTQFAGSGIKWFLCCGESKEALRDDNCHNGHVYTQGAKQKPRHVIISVLMTRGLARVSRGRALCHELSRAVSREAEMRC